MALRPYIIGFIRITQLMLAISIALPYGGDISSGNRNILREPSIVPIFVKPIALGVLPLAFEFESKMNIRFELPMMFAWISYARDRPQPEFSMFSKHLQLRVVIEAVSYAAMTLWAVQSPDPIIALDDDGEMWELTSTNHPS